MVRITAGRFRGRRLAVPRGVRPTTEMARKAAFDILGSSVSGARVLDACAGSGAYGLEALSRGAAHATFVEADARVGRILSRNIESLGAGASARVESRSVAAYAALAGGGSAARFDLIFHDPPFEDASFDDVPALLGLLAPGGTLVHERGDDLLPPAGAPAPADRRRYGTTRILFFRA